MSIINEYKQRYIWSTLLFCCQHFNLALCIGFSLWYAVLPDVLFSTTSYMDQLLNPEIIGIEDQMNRDWLEQIREAFYRMYDEVYGAQRDTQGINTGSDLLTQGNPTLERGEPGASKAPLENLITL
jgi:hypothetical protein